MANNTEPRLTSLSKIINDLNASKQNAVLPVPTDLFASLVTSVKDLSDSVSQLRNDNDRLQQELSSVKSDLITLQQNVGARFPQFQRLPFELRQYVILLIIGIKLTIVLQNDLAHCMQGSSDSYSWSGDDESESNYFHPEHEQRSSLSCLRVGARLPLNEHRDLPSRP
jgi:hypothetical protein